MKTRLLSDDDLYLWNEGTFHRSYERMGSHLADLEGVPGASFAVWAPNARSVSVIGDFNGWDPAADVLAPAESSGIWTGFVAGAEQSQSYKYAIEPSGGGPRLEKADPFGFHHETPPATASKIWDLDYSWGDAAWLKRRERHQALDAPISVYEVHLGSWMRHDDGNHLTYRELAYRLTAYVVELGFTHVEFLPVMEHPFYGSWGYQTTGYFAPTSRFGTPQDFMFLIDTLHQAGIGVILDWVPSHFPTDAHGLASFDGTHLFEHADPRQGYHPDWHSAIFNYGRAEVRGFLTASAMFWLDVYHADAIRVDAVASMLYLDYSRQDGEWIPNRFGGNENLEAIDFLRDLNSTLYGAYPGIQTVAEESTAWPGVSRPTFLGGLGFGLKWDMGWMHDSLSYFSRDPIHRGYHHHDLTFRMIYAFSENFMLPLSHDEVVHGKGSLLGKMPGDDWQKFANLRVLLAHMWAQPAKKLLFMGGEFGQWAEWNHDAALDWSLLDHPGHDGVKRLVGDLNRLYRDKPALHALDCDPAGFQWVDANDSDASVLTFVRSSGDGATVLVALNLTPIPRHQYRIGVPRAGAWAEILNTDAPIYGGSGQGNMGGTHTGPLPIPCHGRPHSIDVVLPPLSAVFFEHRQ